MSTVKIKTEPPATAAAAAATAVDVKVKLESSLSTGDIKLEQHSSDTDTKVESESEADIKSESDDDDDEATDQYQFTIIPKKRRQFICEYHGCSRSFNVVSQLNMHQNEHKLQAELNIFGKTYTLIRQSLTDRWPCPFPDCTSTAKAVDSAYVHIWKTHGSAIKQLQYLQKQPLAKRTRNKYNFIDVDNFYVNTIQCSYHNTIGVFLCYECRLVPECLLTHLQQKHGYDEKSIGNSALPESAVNANANPNINQHISNPHLAAAIRQPYWQQHQDIVQGWLCVTSDCGYCGYTAHNKNVHKKSKHSNEHIATVPALILRLVYTKTQIAYFLITRIDQVTVSNNKVNIHRLDYSHSGLNAQDENEDDVSQNGAAEESNQKRQWRCEHHNCELFFNSAEQLYKHRREHKLEDVITVRGATYTLTRQSSDDRWPCPVPDCETTWKTIDTIRMHIQNIHSTSMKQKRVFIENEDNQQQSIIKRKQYAIYYLKVDGMYVSNTRSGYHTTTGVFICYECRLVPECLLTHLQQKHGFDEKSIDSEFLPESARSTGSDPNINQHISNPHLASAIRNPYQLQHPDIVQGWLCVKTNCGYSGYTKETKYAHQSTGHRGEQLLTAPALAFRLLYGKTQTTYFLITRLDTTTNSIVGPSNSMSQHDSECYGDDSDELVLRDYSDEDDSS